MSDRAVSLQGIYSASKHAVKAYTDALRMELEEQEAPISVSLVKPGATNTMFMRTRCTNRRMMARAEDQPRGAKCVARR